MPIRAVAVDIDGTMTDYERRLDWPGLRALRRVEAEGIPVLCATGNVAPVTKAFANFVGLSGPLVCENGGVVWSNDMTQRIQLHDRRRADAAVARLQRAGLPLRPVWSDPWRQSEVALRLDVDIDRVRKALARTNLQIVTTKFALHVMEPGLDKFQGVRRALKLLRPQVPLKDVLAIGDSDNDVTLLSGCGRSGCVANGTPKAKAAAQYTARRKHGAGVAEILHHYGLA